MPPLLASVALSISCYCCYILIQTFQYAKVQTRPRVKYYVPFVYPYPSKKQQQQQHFERFFEKDGFVFA